jgi:two-component system cell cycle sensor histidine kinase/response regulator CckA
MDGAESNYRRETILVVDDAETVRKMVCAMLEQNGYGCLEACDGHQALQAIEDEPVHLVLTDIVMPGMGGAELATRLAHERPDVRIMFMSGYTEDPLLHHVGRMPSLFLAKPFTAGTLMSRIRQVLDEPWERLK